MNEEITLLEAIHQMCHHHAKRKRIMFEVTFDDGIIRKAYFGKGWSLVMNSWHYLVQDGAHSPQFAYGEESAVSAILSISGMNLCGNVVKYHIRRIL